MDVKVIKIEEHDDDRNTVVLELDDGSYEQLMTEYTIDDLRLAIDTYYGETGES